MKSSRHPSPDDILYAFAVEFDGTPQDVTRWKRRYPLWAREIEMLALEIMLPDGLQEPEGDE